MIKCKKKRTCYCHLASFIHTPDFILFFVFLLLFTLFHYFILVGGGGGGGGVFLVVHFMLKIAINNKGDNVTYKKRFMRLVSFDNQNVAFLLVSIAVIVVSLLYEQLFTFSFNLENIKYSH